MKLLSRLVLSGILFISLACGGGGKSDKGAADDADPAMTLAQEVCTCIDEIEVEPTDTMAYKLAVNSCVVTGMTKTSEVENVGMQELLDAVKEACPEGYAAYQQ